MQRRDTAIAVFRKILQQKITPERNSEPEIFLLNFYKPKGVLNMLFDYAKHQKLWYLLAVCIEEATKENYKGNGCYCGYSELAKLKRRLLQDFFKEDDRGIRNLCFACNTAAEEQYANWYDPDDGLDCKFCPLQWPNGKCCDESHSLYTQLIDRLEVNDTAGAKAICIAIANVKPFTEEEYEKKIS